MYRIRVFNADGTLGGFWTDTGPIADPASAKQFGDRRELSEDLFRAYQYGGSIYPPKVNFDISTIELADTEANNENKVFDYIESTNSTIEQRSDSASLDQLPPFEDRPSRSSSITPVTDIVDFNGGSAVSEQDLDIDGGPA